MTACDQAFAILTRGPFPSGDDTDAVVEKHLAHCPSCRRLAEALRPPVEICQETVAPEESRNLPAYWGEACSSSVDLGLELDDELPEIVERSPGWTQKHKRIRTGAARFVVAAICGALLTASLEWSGFFALMVAQPAKTPAPLPIAPLTVTANKPVLGATADRIWLANLNLPAACQKLVTEAHETEIVAAGHTPATEPIPSLAHLVCCTRCHVADRSMQLAALSTQVVAQSCQACH